MELSVELFISILLIYVVAGMVKGVLGFGLPLVSMSLLPFFIPVSAALAINALISPFTNLSQFVQAKQMRYTLSHFKWVLFGITVGVPIGAYFVSSVDEQTLLFTLGCFIISFTLLTLFSPQFVIPARRTDEVGVVVGFLAGLIGALSTSNGPIFALYLVGLRTQRRLYLSALALFFIFSGVLISGGFWLAGLLDMQRFLIAIAAVPCAIGGMFIGNQLGKKIAAEKFRTLVLLVLVLLGCNLIYQAFSVA